MENGVEKMQINFKGVKGQIVVGLSKLLETIAMYLFLLKYLLQLKEIFIN